MGIVQLLMGTGALAGIQPLPGGTITGANLAIMSLDADGSITLFPGEVPGESGGNWYSPETGGIGSSYYVRATYVSGDALDPVEDWYLAPGTWYSLAGGRNLGFEPGGGLGRTGTYTVDISSDASGTPVVASANYTFSNY
jgi:hypothetical protein